MTRSPKPKGLFEETDSSEYRWLRLKADGEATDWVAVVETGEGLARLSLNDLEVELVRGDFAGVWMMEEEKDWLDVFEIFLILPIWNGED